jgi:hypothetical protein
MMTEQELRKSLSGIPAEVMRHMLNTDIEIDAQHTLRVGEALAKQCMTAARSPRLSREDRERATRAAKGLLSLISDVEEPEALPWQTEL